MNSLYDELAEKVKKSHGQQTCRRPLDLTLLLFNAGDTLRELWLAADLDIAEASREGRAVRAARRRGRRCVRISARRNPR